MLTLSCAVPTAQFQQDRPRRFWRTLRTRICKWKYRKVGWLLEKLLRASYSLRDYRAPALAGAASFALSFAISCVFDQNLNPLRGPVPLSSISIATVFFLAWVTSLDKASDSLAVYLRRSRARGALVGILAVTGYSDEDYKKSPYLRGTNYSPNQWQTKCNEQGLEAQLIYDFANLSQFSIIINPFGELYLEEDLANFKAFHAIKKYIRHGGVFLNVGGLAFYYALDLKSGVEMLTGPPFETYKIVKAGSDLLLERVVLAEMASVVDTLLFEQFGVRTAFGVGQEYETLVDEGFPELPKPNFKINVFRCAIRTENLGTRLVPIVRYRYYHKPDQGQPATLHEAFPIAAVHHDAGYLVVCGMRIDSDDAFNYCAECARIVLNRLCRTGSLTPLD